MTPSPAPSAGEIWVWESSEDVTEDGKSIHVLIIEHTYSRCYECYVLGYNQYSEWSFEEWDMPHWRRLA
jgi:hypothetical protein